MILCSKLKKILCKIVTKSQVVTKFSVTKSRLHCMYDLQAQEWTLIEFILISKHNHPLVRN